MGGFLKKRVIIIVSCAVLFAFGLAVLSAFLGGAANPVANVLGVVVSPFQSGIAAISGWGSSISGYISDYEGLSEENRQLRTRISEMEAEARGAEEALDENVRLRKLLKLSEKRRDFEMEAVRIAAWDSSNWTSAFTISKGENFGIKEKNPVITEEGQFVGYVSKVGYNWATVTTIIDTEAEFGVYLFRTKETAVCEGDFSLMKQGALKLVYLPRGTALQNGDAVLTSGIGGIVPPDLVVGSIKTVGTEDTGISVFAEITPSAELDSLTQVFVIKAFDVTE